MKKYTSKERIKEMMEKLNLRQMDIVEKTGIPKSSLSSYLSGAREPRQDQLSIIADPFGINPAWLMGYDVPMYLKDIWGEKEIEEEVSKLHEADARLIHYFLKLNEMQKKKVMQIIEIMSEEE